MKTILTLILLILPLSYGCGEKDYAKLLNKARKNRKEAENLRKKADKWYAKSFENYKKAYAMDMSVFAKNDYHAFGDMYEYLDKNPRQKEYMYKQAISAKRY